MKIKTAVNTITTKVRKWFNSSPDYAGRQDLDPTEIDDFYRRINRGEYRRAVRDPYFRKQLREVSIMEDEENSYYTGMLNLVADQTLGSCPQLLGHHEMDDVNDRTERAWIDWTTKNGIGSVFRQLRRGAARTGIAIGIPYKKNVDPTGLGFSIRTVCSTNLSTPPGVLPEDRILDGIEYDENWDPIKIYIESGDPMNPTPYDIEDIIFWYKRRVEGMITGVPECAPAFCLFPAIRRYMDAIVRAEEFRSCIPMVVELDEKVYRPEDTTDVPTGKMKYEPGTIPTLPPGTKLNGLPTGMSSEEKTKFVRLVIGAAGRCFTLPVNVAIGDSADHNMATAQVDIQPWINWTNIDRADFAPVCHQVYNWWHERAIRKSGLLPVQARNNFPYDFYYDSIFSHPDPQKRANARDTDLKSGSTTLHRVFTDQGLNPRRERQREARTLGLTMEEYNQLVISARANAPNLLEGSDEQTN
jgi:hypothetical protein